MHSAPPVVYPVGRSLFQAAVLLSVWGGALLVSALWMSAGRTPVWAMLVAGIFLAASAMAVAQGWRHSPVGKLGWDGEGWRWESAGYQTGVARQRLFVILDFQSVLVLRLENPARASLWLWAERGAFPERWMDLRRAAYCPQSSHDLITGGERADPDGPQAHTSASHTVAADQEILIKS